MLEIDGGDGGGQIVRSAVSLAALTGTPVAVEDVRGSRPNPGLKRQHLAAVECLSEICAASVDGDELGSERITFEPGEPSAGAYGVDIGTAGSTTLVADAVLPLALAVDEPISLTIHGGTDVKWSPTADYLRQVKLPLLCEHGLVAAVEIGRRGYYPEGGGELTLRLGPSRLREFEMETRGAHREVSVFGSASRDLADAEVARRMVRTVRDLLQERGLPVGSLRSEYDDAPSTGAAVVLGSTYGTGVIGADALGEPGVPAEEVATEAVDTLLERHRGTAAVDEHLADQLLLYLAIAGGSIRIPRVTEHVRTSLELLDAFGLPLQSDPVGDDIVVSGPRRLDERSELG